MRQIPIIGHHDHFRRTKSIRHKPLDKIISTLTFREKNTGLSMEIASTHILTSVKYNRYIIAQTSLRTMRLNETYQRQARGFKSRRIQLRDLVR